MIDETIARQAPALRDPSSALGQSEDLGGSGGFTPGALSSTRSEILAAHAEARLNERHRLALAYLRLALMADLLECLWFEDPAEAARLAHFCEECLAKLDFDLGEDEETEITQWILETTGARWGEFLHLLDEEKKPSVDAGRTRRSGSPCDRSSLSIDALQRDDGIALASKGKIDREVEAHAAGKSDDQVFASLLGFGGELDDYRSSQGDSGFLTRPGGSQSTRNSLIPFLMRRTTSSNASKGSFCLYLRARIRDERYWSWGGASTP